MITQLMIACAVLCGQAEEPAERQFIIEAAIYAVENAPLRNIEKSRMAFFNDDGRKMQFTSDAVSEGAFRLDPESGEPVFKTDGDVTVEVLSRPQLTVIAGQEARIEKSQDPVPYMERVDVDNFTLHTMETGPSIAISVLANAADKPGFTELEYEMEICRVEGREQFEGVDLPIGKPKIYRGTSDGKAVVSPDEWVAFLQQAADDGSRHIIVSLRARPAAPDNPGQFSAESKVLLVPAATWKAWVAKSKLSDDPRLVALHESDANMPTAVAADPWRAEPVRGSARHIIFAMPYECIAGLAESTDDLPDTEVLTAPRTTWTPAVGSSADAKTLFKMSMSSSKSSTESVNANGGFGGGGFGGGGRSGNVAGPGQAEGKASRAPSGGGLSEPSSVLDWLKVTAPTFWSVFDPLSDTSNRPVLIADYTRDGTEAQNPVYNGFFLGHRLTSTDLNNIHYRQALYFRLADYTFRTGFLGREKRDDAGFAIFEGWGESPIEDGETLFAAFRMPETGNVVLVFTTIERIDNTGARVFHRE